jgi:hypothetical protein
MVCAGMRVCRRIYGPSVRVLLLLLQESCCQLQARNRGCLCLQQRLVSPPPPLLLSGLSHGPAAPLLLTSVMGVSLTRSAPCFCNKPLVICTRTQTHTCRQHDIHPSACRACLMMLPDQQVTSRPRQHAAASAAAAARAPAAAGAVVRLLCDCLRAHLVSTLVLSDLQAHDTYTHKQPQQSSQQAGSCWCWPHWGLQLLPRRSRRLQMPVLLRHKGLCVSRPLTSSPKMYTRGSRVISSSSAELSASRTVSCSSTDGVQQGWCLEISRLAARWQGGVVGPPKSDPLTSVVAAAVYALLHADTRPDATCACGGAISSRAVSCRPYYTTDASKKPSDTHC